MTLIVRRTYASLSDQQLSCRSRRQFSQTVDNIIKKKKKKEKTELLCDLQLKLCESITQKHKHKHTGEVTNSSITAGRTHDCIIVADTHTHTHTHRKTAAITEFRV